MHKLKAFLTLIIIVGSLAICNAQTGSKSVLTDFNTLVGRWQGSLTYLDYTSGKPYTMPADVDISRLGNTNKFAFSNIYPKERSANSVDTISISNDGQFIDREVVRSRKVLNNGDIEIVTEEKGQDGNDHKPATFRHTYLIGKAHYSKRKEVQFDGETQWIKRHEYTYTIKP